jgi:uncharacterized protein (TIGR02996 family)
VIRTYEESFLDDIIRNADQDAPRLIYADWLEEQGQLERAEFIRLQCRLASHERIEEDRARLVARVNDLLGRFSELWRAELPVLPGVIWEDFQRGFIESVQVLDVDLFLEYVTTLFAAAPIRILRLNTVDDAAVERLCQEPALRQLYELNLGNCPGLGIRGVRTLSRCRHLSGLRSLLLHYGNLGDLAVMELGQATCLTNLRELYVSGNDLTDRAVLVLANSNGFPHLRELDLRDNRIGDLGVCALACSPQRNTLETLYLVNNRIGPEGAAALADSDHLRRLQRLYLNYNAIGDQGAIAFARTPQRRSLVELDLRQASIRDPGGVALAQSSCLDGLQQLWLGGNRFSNRTRELLRHRFGSRVRL